MDWKGQVLVAGDRSSMTSSLLARLHEEETKSNDEGPRYSAAASSNPMKPPDCRAQKRA
jgi:hypothetical protein